MNLTGKVAVITGGGRGIGRGIVDRFREAGAQVAVVQRRTLDSELDADPNVLHIEADLSDPATPEYVVQRAGEAFGGVDILVNNAGVMFEKHLSELTVDDWDVMAEINLRAPLFLAQEALPEFQKRGAGSIINIGSVEGKQANPLHTAYAETKAGVHGMTRAMAIDLGRYGVRCNAIAPGWIETDLSAKYLASRANSAATREALIALHPAGRLGTPEDIGNLAVFLASDNAAFLTGEVITLDGGRTVRLPTPD